MDFLSVDNVICFLAGAAAGSVAYHISLKIKSNSYKVIQKNITAQGDVAGRDIHKPQWQFANRT